MTFRRRRVAIALPIAMPPAASAARPPGCGGTVRGEIRVDAPTVARTPVAVIDRTGAAART